MILAVLLTVAATTLVPGTASTYTNGSFTWAGNPYCVGQGYNYTLQPTSPAIDAGILITGFHCPNPGSAINQPKQSNGSFCVEWYGKAPDIGACEFVPATATTKPPAPGGLGVQNAPFLGL